LDLLLTGKAATWAETDINIIEIFAETAPTQTSINNFKTRFTKKYPRPINKIIPISFNIEIVEFKQSPEKSFLSYYKRVLTLISRIRAKDCKSTTTINTNPIPLTPFESAIFNIILRTFIRDIVDKKIKYFILKYIISPDRSLLNIYITVEDYYYYSSNLRAYAVCDYGTLSIMRQDLSSYLTTYIYKYIRSYRMIFFYFITVKLSNCLLRLRDSEC